jgi:hypothetical protein
VLLSKRLAATRYAPGLTTGAPEEPKSRPDTVWAAFLFIVYCFLMVFAVH